MDVFFITGYSQGQKGSGLGGTSIKEGSLYVFINSYIAGNIEVYAYTFKLVTSATHAALYRVFPEGLTAKILTFPNNFVVLLSFSIETKLSCSRLTWLQDEAAGATRRTRHVCATHSCVWVCVWVLLTGNFEA